MHSDSEADEDAKAKKGRQGTTRKPRTRQRRDLDGSLLLPERVPGPTVETTRNVRRSLEAPFNIAAVGVSLVNQERDDERSVDMDLEQEIVDPESRFKIEVRDIVTN